MGNNNKVTSLVFEVQEAAMDKQVPVSELLLKAKALSVKLASTELRNWIECESHGYPPESDLPAYRVKAGKPRCFDPNNGYRQLFSEDPEIQQYLTRAPIFEGVGTIEVSADSSDKVSLHYNHEMQSLINEVFALRGMVPSIQLSKGALVSVLDKVRGIVLDWSLELEAQGVKGEGMTFSAQEKERAAIVNNNYITNNIGTMNNSQLQQASDNSAQAQTNAEIDYEKVEWLADKVKSNIDKFGISGEVVVELEGELDTVYANLRNAKPDIDIIGPALSSIKNILEGVVGGTLATEYAAEINTFLESLPAVV